MGRVGPDRIIVAINAEGIPYFSGICSEIYLDKLIIPIKNTDHEALT